MHDLRSIVKYKGWSIGFHLSPLVSAVDIGEFEFSQLKQTLLECTDTMYEYIVLSSLFTDMCVSSAMLRRTRSLNLRRASCCIVCRDCVPRRAREGNGGLKKQGCQTRAKIEDDDFDFHCLTA